MKLDLPYEIERRWIVADTSIIPTVEYERFYIQQGYLAQAKGMAIRVRVQTNAHNGEVTCYLTFKGKKDDSGKAVELEYEIPESDAHFLLQRGEAKLEKNRYVFSVDGVSLHFDVFIIDSEQKGKHNIVEVEFNNVEDATAFKPLPWFGKEITNVDGYSNYSLAFNGWPKEL